MTVVITSLRVDEGKGSKWSAGEYPYIIVNITFKVHRYEDDYLWLSAKASSEDYQKVITVDDPDHYEKFLDEVGEGGALRLLTEHYSGMETRWTANDTPWRYIEKFDTFHFREWIADCRVTRTILDELYYYQQNGRLLDNYRTVDGAIVLQHIKTLSTYWD